MVILLISCMISAATLAQAGGQVPGDRLLLGSHESVAARELLSDARSPRSWCGQAYQKCCRQNKCLRPLKCHRGICVRRGKPCGNVGEICCPRKGRSRCRDGLVCIDGHCKKFRPAACVGLEDSRCCDQKDGGAACEPGLVCRRTPGINDGKSKICKPCGDEGELACDPSDQDPDDEGDLVCNGHLRPVLNPAEDRTFCENVPSDTSCPGLLGEPCCTFIADASPCGEFVACSVTQVDSPDFGGDIADGTCVACGGEHQLACFEISLLGPSGPICRPGLSADLQEPPRCVVGGTGPPCTGVLCPNQER